MRDATERIIADLKGKFESTLARMPVSVKSMQTNEFLVKYQGDIRLATIGQGKVQIQAGVTPAPPRTTRATRTQGKMDHVELPATGRKRKVTDERPPRAGSGRGVVAATPNHRGSGSASNAVPCTPMTGLQGGQNSILFSVKKRPVGAGLPPAAPSLDCMMVEIGEGESVSLGDDRAIENMGRKDKADLTAQMQAMKDMLEIQMAKIEQAGQ